MRDGHTVEAKMHGSSPPPREPSEIEFFSCPMDCSLGCRGG